MRKRLAAKVVYRSQEDDAPTYRSPTMDRAVAVLMRGGRWRYRGCEQARPLGWEEPAPLRAPVRIRIVVAREGAVRPARGP